MIFRIKNTDTIKAHAVSPSGKLLSSIYDSGFTTIDSVVSSLVRKIPHYGGRKIDITITNIDKDIVKNLHINVNK